MKVMYRWIEMHVLELTRKWFGKPSELDPILVVQVVNEELNHGKNKKNSVGWIKTFCT